MKFFDKIKDLFSDEEEVIETKEIEVEEQEEHKLPTFMRNKIAEEEKREQERKQKEECSDIISDREIVRTRTGNNFSFPIEVDDDIVDNSRYSQQNVLLKERERNFREKEKSLEDLYAKKEEPKPKKFKPTPVISPVYGILDKNYTKDEVKIQDQSSYEIQRPSRKVDFETVRNKAFGSLTDDIRNNLCENCELYQEVRITKNVDRKSKSMDNDINLLSDMTEDVSLGDAEDNYFDFGVSYEVPTRREEGTTVINADKVEVEVEVNNEIKIVNHNDEESSAEKIEVKEKVENKLPVDNDDKLFEDTKEFEKISHDEESIDDILGNVEDISSDLDNNDIFNLIDSMYDEEEK
ncbi:MAG: hypothetical protein IJZ46_01270 [Bacilli bacterium]|nr:hypothetical protein [Bacilli bacterium]